MDLQDWPDDELDGWVTASLQSETFVSERQKQRAWAQGRQNAARQQILPSAKPHQTAQFYMQWSALREMILRPCRWLIAIISDLMVDDGVYARASRRRSRLFRYEYQQTYMIYRLSA